MTPQQKETIRSAMSILGQQKSEAKTKAARANAKKPRNRVAKIGSEQIETNAELRK